MGKFVNFCAGVNNLVVLPANKLEGLLVNVPNVGKNETTLKNLNKLLQATNPDYLMLDSGGFQILEAEGKGILSTFNGDRPLIWNKRELNIASRHVIETASMTKPFVVVGLDRPILKLKDVNERQKEFLGKLGYNAAWTIDGMKRHSESGQKSQLFIPVQCYTILDFDLFYSMIGSPVPDGFCMPVRNMKTPDTLLFLARFSQIGVKRVHLLGTTAKWDIALGAYMARHHFEWFSIDSQTWRIAAENQIYLNPWDLGSHLLKKNVKVRGEQSFNCPCHWCEHRSIVQFKNMDPKDMFYYLCRHNFWVTDRFTKDAFNNAAGLTTLKRFLLSRLRNTRQVDSFIRALTAFNRFKDVDIRSLERALKLIR